MKMISILFVLITAYLPAQTGDSIVYEKDIRIFEGILRTMLGVEDTDYHFRHAGYENQVKGTYLKKQGLLIEIDTRFFAESMISSRHLPRVRFPETPMPPLMLRFFEDSDFEVPEIEEEAELAVFEAMRAAEEQMTMDLEARELDKEQDWLEEEREFLKKELQEQLVLVERQKAMKKAQLAMERSEFKEKMKTHKMEVSKVKEELEKQKRHQFEAVKKYKAQLDEIRKEHQENWVVEADKIRTSIVDALCQYGASIRTVKDGEFFTVILKGFEHNDSGDRVNRIYIFSKASILSCRNGDISQEELFSMCDSYLSR